MTTTTLQALVSDLRRALGPRHVLDTPEDLIAFEYDATIERALPDVAVFPATTEEVAAAVLLARRYGVPVVPRGSGTGLSGGAVPVNGGVMVVLTRMNRIVEIDTLDRVAVVQPGVINLHLQEALAPHGLTWAPDPSSQRVCTVGGNVANNSGGPHTLAHGSTVNHVLALEVVLPDGRIVNLGSRVPDAPGIDLRGLMVGSEGTLGIVTRATLRLVRASESVRTFLAVFDSVEAASEAVSGVIRRGIIPVAMEMLDQEIIRIVEPRIHAGYPLDAGAVLLIEVEGLAEGVAQDAATVEAACLEAGAREVRSAEAKAERDALWEGRKAAIGAIGAAAPAFYLLDGVVPRTRLPAVMKQVMALTAEYGFRCANVFHAGDGNLHPNIMFDPAEPDAERRVLALGEAIMRVCVDAGGSVTGEHGVGLEKRSYMEWVFRPADLDAMTMARDAFGGAGFFNPCKVLPGGHGCATGHAAELAAVMSDPRVYV
ncbi:MAG: FAD-binding protein [Chloroflexi bacterium]|nr:FAD-binding protein [Chloroflexota bacterium]MDA1239255.1 FAD-binding protein [Chloroflexota bacterium]